MNHDLTTGSPKKVLLFFTLPLFGSILLQQMYNVVDSLVAGKFIGETALAAVSNSYEVTLIYLAFATGGSIGVSVVISQLFGAGRYRDLKTAVSTTFLSVIALCAVLMTAGFLFGEPLLKLIDTPLSLLPDTLLYLNIFTAGLPALFLYNICTGIFSALGDSRTPLIFLAFSSFSNIGMDILFVAGFGMGVAGVAWATFLCQTVSCVLAAVTLFFRLRETGPKEPFSYFDRAMLGRLCRVAVPSILQQSFVSVGNIVVQKAVNGYFDSETASTAMMAGYGAAIKINNLAINCIMTVANGNSNFVGQNIGARKPERVRQGYRGALLYSGVLCLLFSLLYVVFGGFFVGLFLEGDSAEALRIGKTFLLVVSPFYFLAAVKVVTDSVIRGAGAMKFFLITTFADLILRAVLAWVFPLFISSEVGLGIWMAWPVGWFIASLLSLTFYKKGVWKTAF